LISSGSQSVTRHIMSFRKVILEEPLTKSQALIEGEEFEAKSGFMGNIKVKGKLTSDSHPKGQEGDSNELCIKIEDFEAKKPDAFKDPKKRDNKSWSEFTSGVKLSFKGGEILVKVKFFDELVVDRLTDQAGVRLSFPADARVIKLEGRMDRYRLILDSWQPPDNLPETEEDNPQEYFGVEIFPAKIKRRYEDAKKKRDEEKAQAQQKSAVDKVRDQMAVAFVKEETPVLTHLGTHILPPKQVIFEHGPEPELTLAFADTQDGSVTRTTIHFLDDAGRERWRQALAWFISKLGSGWRREE